MGNERTDGIGVGRTPGWLQNTNLTCKRRFRKGKDLDKEFWQENKETEVQ